MSHEHLIDDTSASVNVIPLVHSLESGNDISREQLGNDAKEDYEMENNHLVEVNVKLVEKPMCSDQLELNISLEIILTNQDAIKLREKEETLFLLDILTDLINVSVNASESKVKNTEESVQLSISVGGVFDCLDYLGVWIVGRVLEIRCSKVLIRWEYFHDVWDSWIELASVSPYDLIDFLLVFVSLHSHSNFRDLKSYQGVNVDLLEIFIANAELKIEEFELNESWSNKKMEIIKSLCKFAEIALSANFKYEHALLIERLSLVLNRSVFLFSRCLNFLSKNMDQPKDFDTPNYLLDIILSTLLQIVSSGKSSNFYSVCVALKIKEPILKLLISNLTKDDGLCGISVVFSGRSSLFIFESIIQLYAIISNYISSEEIVNYFAPVANTVTQRALTLSSEEIKSLDREWIKGIIRNLKIVLNSLDSDSKTVNKVTEELNVNFALKLLESPYLEKKVNGISEIGNVISFFYAGNSSLYYDVKGNISKNNLSKDVNKHFSRSTLAELLESHHFIEVILEADSHVELVKRFSPIFKLFSDENRLTKEQLLLLWSKTEGDRHESVVIAVYDCILNVLASLSVDFINTIYERMLLLPFESYNDRFFTFFQKFCSMALKVTSSILPNKLWYGLDLYWSVSQNSKLPLHLRQLSVNALQATLTLDECDSQLPIYLLKCCESVKSDSHCLLSLQLIQLLFSIYSTSKQYLNFRDRLSRSEVISSFDTQEGLIVALIDEFTRYYKTKNENEFSLLENVAKRLELLLFLLTNSGVQLTNDLFDILWNALILESNLIFPNILTFCNWVLLLCRHGCGDRLSLHIFDSICSFCGHKDFERILPYLYPIFEYLFRYINGSVLVHPNMFKRIIITQFDSLKGLDFLWSVVFATEQEPVSRAMYLLTTLYLNLDPKCYNLKMRELFIHSFVKKLLIDITDPLFSDPVLNKSKLARVVEVLDFFLGRLVLDKVIPPARLFDEQEPRQISIHITVFANKSPSNLNVTLDKDTSLGTLRVRLADHFSVSKDLIVFVRIEDILHPEMYDHLSVSQAELDNSLNVYVVLIDDPRRVLRPTFALEYVQELLSNDFFDRIFDFLKFGESICDLSWKLLCKLPTNSKLSSQIKSFVVGVDQKWEDLFDCTSEAKFLCCLRIAYDFASTLPANVSLEMLISEYDKVVSPESVIVATIESDSSSVQIVEQKEYSKLSCNEQHVVSDRILENSDVGISVEKSVDIIADSQTKPLLIDNLMENDIMSLRWCYQFLKNGGFKFLLNYFLKLNVEKSNNAVLFVDSATLCTKMFTLALLVDVSNYFKLFNYFTEEFLLKFFCIFSACLRCSVPEQYKIACINSFLNLLEKIYTCSEFVKIQIPSLELERIFSLVYADVYGDGIGKPFSSRFTQFLIFLSEISSNDNLPYLEISQALFSILPQVVSYSSSENENYFLLVSDIIELSSKYNGILNEESLFLYYSSIWSTLSERKVLEISFNDVDKVLIGLFRVLISFFKHFSVSISRIANELSPMLLEFLFSKCLFELPKQSTDPFPPPLCKSAISRSLVFDLILLIVQANFGDNCFVLLSKLLLENHLISHSGGKQPDNFEFCTNSEVRSISGYVGIRNPASICYMNALLQQLFMLPSLRKKLLKIDELDNSNIKDDFLAQLQFLFTFMQESEKMFVNPQGFTSSFKDWDGNAMDVRIQMDTQEFLNLLFDRIDSRLKDTKHKSILKESFGGVYSNQLVGKQEETTELKACSHVSERNEDFYVVPLEIKGKKNIIDSLDLFTKGEMLDGANSYLCSKCNAKVATLKRVCFKDLPKTIIFQLKRFDFNLDTMEKIKLNDKIEFPNILDLKPYLMEGLTEPNENKNFVYELRGIIVHAGTANNGHYYSFIKERETSDPSLNLKWCEFNDKVVRDFNPSNIPEECFGGEDDSIKARFMTNSIVSKHKSAYLLFYDRIDSEILINNPTVVVPDVFVPSHRKSDSTPLRRHSSLKVSVPLDFRDIVWEDNRIFWMDHYVYQTSYVNFMKKFIFSFESQRIVPIEMVKLATRFICFTLIRSNFKEKESLDDWFNLLLRWYGMDHTNWLISLFSETSSVTNNSVFNNLSSFKSDGLLVDTLLICPNIKVRSHIYNLLWNSIKTEYAKSDNSLENNQLCFSEEYFELKRNDNSVFYFVDKLIFWIPYAICYWKNFGMYFRLLLNIAGLSEELRKFMISRKLIDILCNYLSENAEFFKYCSLMVNSKVTLGDGNFMNVYWIDIIRLFSCLLNSVPKNFNFEFMSDPFIIHALLRLSTTKARGNCVLNICQIVSKSSKHVSEQLLSGMMNGITYEFNDYELQRCYFRVLVPYLNTKDDLEDFRCSFVMPKLVKAIKDYSLVYWKCTDFCIEHLARLANIDCVRNWLLEHESDWVFIVSWLRNNPHPPVRKLFDSDKDVLKMFKPDSARIFQGVSYTGETSFHEVKSSKYNISGSYGGSFQDKLRAFEKIKSKLLLNYSFDDSDDEFSERTFCVGDMIDCLDSIDVWLLADIININESHVLVHYCGWPSKWDEWIDKSSSRLAPRGKFTLKRNTIVSSCCLPCFSVE